MKKLLILLLLIGLQNALFAQRPLIYKIEADSVKITNSCDTAELIIENHTQTVPGFLYNKGRGRTEFRPGAIKINESIYIIGGDTLYIPHVNANNGTSIVNGNVVLGNDLGSSSAALTNTREIPLNNQNVVFTGNGKVGIGTNNPRDLIEIGTPVYRRDSATANLRFTYMNEPTRYYNTVWNKFTGDPWENQIGFSLTNQGNTVTPVIISADSKIHFKDHVICSGDVGINKEYPRGMLDLVPLNDDPNVNAIVLGGADGYHYHSIKTSFHGAWAPENKIRFYVYKGNDLPDTAQVNPLNLLGDGNAIFNGNIGLQKTSPSAHIHIGPGASAVGTAPIKLTAGTLLAAPEDGAIEFDGANLYFTENATRYKLSKILSGQHTTNFGGPVAAFSSLTASFAVWGAQPGDVVNVSANTGAVNPTSIIITAYVTSANTVTLQAYNASNSAVTIASDTYKVRIIK
jgi:hypothetical protein